VQKCFNFHLHFNFNSKKMPPATFFSSLTIISAITAIGLFGLNQITAIAPYSNFSWLCLGSFIGLSLLMYAAGYFTVHNDNKHIFTSIILGSTLGKMMLSIILVALYYKFAMPTSKVFVIPFFIVYLIFTSFETWFMMKLGKQQR